MHPAESSPAPQAVRQPGALHPRDHAVAHVVDFATARRARAASQRDYARQTGVPRTTLQGWLRKAAPADADDDATTAAFFESPAGLRLLHRLEVALLFVMTLVGAASLRHVALVFRLVGLDRWIASSHGRLCRRAVQLEECVGLFATDARGRLAATMRSHTISTCQDETFHPAPCLVAIEPVSGFVLLERYAPARDERAWTAAMTLAMAGLPVTIAQVTSDEASGLRKHVRLALGARPSSDIFHVQYEVTRGTSAPLAARVRRATEAVDTAATARDATLAAEMAWIAAPGPGPRPDWSARYTDARVAHTVAVDAQTVACARQDAMRAAVRDIGTAYHPFDLTTGAPRVATLVETELHAVFDRATEVATAAAVRVKGLARIAKARRVVANLVASIAWFHRTVAARVAAIEAPLTVHALLLGVLIPALYLRRVAGRTGGADARAKLRTHADALLASLDATAAWTALATPLQAQAWALAQELADLFQRSSSCVEGRNGQLSLRHHHLHRLSDRKLAALTAVHNYFLRRPDGTTAAERFFGAPSGDLFEHLCATLPLPARPRRRASPAPQTEPLAATG